MNRMRKSFAALLALAILCTLLPTASAENTLSAAEQREGEFSFVISDGKATVTAAPQTGNVTIPDTLGGAPVCCLNPSLFENAAELVSVELPGTVTEIPFHCFCGCVKLESIDLSNVSRIHERAFFQCALKTLTLSSAIRRIEKHAFCFNGFSELVLPEGLEYLGMSAFNSCQSCTHISLPSTLQYIDDYVFYKTKTDELTLPDALTHIGSYAFSNSLRCSLRIDGHVKTIGENAFAYGYIPSLEISGEITELPKYCFGACIFDTVLLHEGTKRIGEGAFSGCTFRQITLPESLEELGPNTFSFCTGTDSLTIPQNVMRCENAFEDCRIGLIYGSSAAVEEAALLAGCRYIDLVTGKESQQPYDVTVDGIKYHVFGNTVTLIDGFAAEGRLEIPEQIEGKPLVKIGAKAFYGNYKLTEVIVPDCVKSLGDEAFRECRALESVILGSGITELPAQCFIRCERLQHIVLPQGLHTIGEYAFQACASLTDVSLPDALRIIEKNAFDRSPARVFLPPDIEQIGTYALNCGARLLYLGESFDYGLLYGWEGMDELLQPITEKSWVIYRKGTRAEEYIQKLRIAEGNYKVLSWELPEEDGLLITPDAVYRLTEDHAELVFCPIVISPDDTEIVLPETVEGLPLTVIRENAFQCDTQYWGLVTVYLSESVTRIGANAFSALHHPRILFPGSVTQIDDSAFEGCSYVTFYGVENTTAESFAQEHGIPFKYWLLPFKDVDENAWYYDAVGFVFNSGLMKGMDKHTFSPETTVTRAQLAQVLYNMNGNPAENWANNWEYGFEDVPSSAWYAKPVNWGVFAGLFNGISRTQFAPDAPLTREQLVTVFYRYIRELRQGTELPSDTDLSGYTDAGEISAYAKDAMRWAVQAGIVNGVTKTQLSPKGTATRAQIAVILERFVRLMGNN